MKNKILLLFTVFGSLLTQIQGQVIVNSTSSVNFYVQNVLLGAGVTVSNVTINGAAGSTTAAQLATQTFNLGTIGVSHAF